MANKIIVVVGPQEGVGKTTLAANLAVRYAQTRRQPVLLIDADPLSRGELTQVSGAPASPSVAELLETLANSQIALPMLRGRVPLNRLNIGCAPIAAPGHDIQHLTAEHFKFFLESFSQLYDLIIDIEMTHPLKIAALDAADVVIW